MSQRPTAPAGNLQRPYHGAPSACRQSIAPVPRAQPAGNLQRPHYAPSACRQSTAPALRAQRLQAIYSARTTRPAPANNLQRPYHAPSACRQSITPIYILKLILHFSYRVFYRVLGPITALYFSNLSYIFLIGYFIGPNTL